MNQDSSPNTRRRPLMAHRDFKINPQPSTTVPQSTERRQELPDHLHRRGIRFGLPDHPSPIWEQVASVEAVDGDTAT